MRSKMFLGMGLVMVVALMGCARLAEMAAPGKPVYVVKRTEERPKLEGNWDGPVWQQANELRITHYFPPGTLKVKDDFQPDARARVLYDKRGLYVHFRVEDQYVRSIATEYRGAVWEDSAVEFFVQPRPERGYFNFEINCGGAMLLSYHENPEWDGPSLHKPGGVPWVLAQRVKIYHSMPETVDPEIAGPVTWYVEYFIPFSLFETYLGPIGDLSEQRWRANFYKIAENNSHPHYGAWSPILEGASFHAPQFFGVLKFSD